MPKMNLYLGSLSDYCHALVYKAAARNVKRPDVSPRNRSYPHSKVTLRVRETVENCRENGCAGLLYRSESPRHVAVFGGVSVFPPGSNDDK